MAVRSKAASGGVLLYGAGRTLLAACLVALGLGLAAGERTEGARSESARREAYRQAVLAVKADYKIPGVVAGVWVPGMKAWTLAEGYADVASGRPISLADHFPIRSVTKSFTVTLILKLARAEALSLDDPIGKFVPGIPNGDRITLANLAGMESGVKNYTETAEFLTALQADPAKQWAPREIVDLTLPYSPVFEPGAEYDYSNTNTILLGMVVEEVTQRPIAEQYRKGIFKPLGLRQTSYPNGMTLPAPCATPYLVDRATGRVDECPMVNLSCFGSAGGMVTTLGNLHRYGRALGDGRLVGKSLQATRLAHSRAVTSGPEYDRYGLGIGELKGWWGHTGEGIGFQAATFYDPRTGAVIAVLLNSSQSTNVATEVFKALAGVFYPEQKGNRQ